MRLRRSPSLNPKLQQPSVIEAEPGAEPLGLVDPFAAGASDPVVSATSDAACLEAFQRELDYIYSSLRRLGIPPSELEDLGQEVFLVLRRNWGVRDQERPLRPYLFGIAFRIASSYRRKRGREVPILALDAVPDERADAEESLQKKQARGLVLMALERVPLPRRAVLLMHDLDEIPMSEAAAALGIHLFTAYTRLRKARRELASNLRRILGRTRLEIPPLRRHN